MALCQLDPEAWNWLHNLDQRLQWFEHHLRYLEQLTPFHLRSQQKLEQKLQEERLIRMEEQGAAAADLDAPSPAVLQAPPPSHPPLPLPVPADAAALPPPPPRTCAN